jgi:hypothetical protein
MSLFDFPRIHFHGQADINVPTINNAYYFPLTIYDATRSQGFLPPRLYFSSAEKITSVQSSIQPPPTPVYDAANNYYYIEILPVNTIEILREWCMNPLGTLAVDQNYIPFYQAAEQDLCPVEGLDGLMGQAPGYWNMYGDMGVYVSDTQVCGVQLCDQKGVHTYAPGGADLPPAVQPFMNLSFDLDTTPASGITTATMVETISNQSVYANIFCSRVNVYNTNDPGQVMLSGIPCRFSAMIYSAWRVMNWFPPMAGSARFCASIPLEEIDDADQSELLAFFRNNRFNDSREIKGVFVSFCVLEVFENRYNQQIYIENGTASNPVQCTFNASITPWYEGDMRSGLIGRNLVSYNAQPVYYNMVPAKTHQGPAIPVQFTPVMSSVLERADGSVVYSVDMGNSWPEQIVPDFDPANPPVRRGDASFQTLNLGVLRFYAGEDGPLLGILALDNTINPLNTV